MSAAAVPAPRPRRRWIWVIAAVLTTLVVVPPFALRIWLKADIQHQTVPVPVAARPVTALQVDAPGGNVDISRGPGRHVTMSSTAAWLVRKPVIAQAWHGRTLQVRAACPRLNPFEDGQESLVVQVPAGHHSAGGRGLRQRLCWPSRSARGAPASRSRRAPGTGYRSGPGRVPCMSSPASAAAPRPGSSRPPSAPARSRSDIRPDRAADRLRARPPVRPA